MKTFIKGHTVEYDDDAKGGVRYLTYLIDAEEAKVFFNQAFSRGSASFEDQMGYDYKLSLNGSEYRLERVKH